jgi:restriction system protein
MPVPDFQTLMLPTLRAANGGEVTMPQAREFVAAELGLTDKDVSEVLPSGRQTVIVNRVAWAKSYMERAGLLKSTRRGVFSLTEDGRALLDSNPARIDNTVLSNYSSFNEWRMKTQNVKSDASPMVDSKETETPEERLERDHETLDAALRGELLERLREGTPAFFEQVVIDILIAMGYGGGRAQMGKAIGKSGDGGIDGVINEDTLGLDAVYIQAKKYAEGNTIGAGDLRNFSGALDDVGTNKGVFVTTSSFSVGARDYAQRIPKRIILIDGDRLSQLMIQHNVGVRVKSVYEVKRLDEDYFVD